MCLTGDKPDRAIQAISKAMNAFKPGLTVPPFHPNCRCGYAPFFDDEWAYEGTRAARGKDGKTYQVPAGMSYEEWKGKAVEGGGKDGLTEFSIGAIVSPKLPKDGGPNVQTVGHIDIEKYRCIADDITTDEVIITPERIQHIKERQGKDFLEKYEQYFSLILSYPDYIFADERPNTAIVCKVIGEGEGAINLVLRLVVKEDDPT